MREATKKLRWLGSALLILGGCQATQSQVKPKYQNEEYVQPPNDPRFSNEIDYPKDTLFQDVIKKGNQPKDTMGPGGLGGGPGMGAGPGMR